MREGPVRRKRLVGRQADQAPPQVVGQARTEVGEPMWETILEALRRLLAPPPRPAPVPIPVRVDRPGPRR
jgi:hypothetical protein